MGEGSKDKKWLGDRAPAGELTVLLGRARGALVPIELSSEPFEMPNIDLLALDTALNRLAEVHPRQAKIVELRFFAGLSESEIAELLEVSRVTVSRDWKVARLRLRRDMRG